MITGFVLAGMGTGVIAATALASSAWVRGGCGALGGVVGLLGSTVVTGIYDRRAARAAAIRERSRVLAPAVTEPAGGSSVFDVMLATRSDAPFWGRRRELARLERWWEDPVAPPVAVVTGPAGSGKTRLVARFASQRPGPWVVGWLRSGRGADVVAAVRVCGNPALILVDDADEELDVATLLDNLVPSRVGAAIRVVLIARAAGLSTRLARRLSDQSRSILPPETAEIPVGTLGGADDRFRWYGEAVRFYAKALSTPPPDLPTGLGGKPFDPDEPILTLHAQALLAVLDSRRSRPMTPHTEIGPFDQVAAALFAHEEHR